MFSLMQLSPGRIACSPCTRLASEPMPVALCNSSAATPLPAAVADLPELPCLLHWRPPVATICYDVAESRPYGLPK